MIYMIICRKDAKSAKIFVFEYHELFFASFATLRQELLMPYIIGPDAHRTKQ
jgi:hypothetical protein